MTMEHLPVQQEGFIPVEHGLQLFYRQIGNGPEVIVVPSGSWLEADFEPLFTPSRTLIFYDTRGQGASAGVEDPSQLEIDYDLRDLEALRQFLNFDQMMLLGWSMHGATVARFAAMHPEYITRLVMMCPGYIRSDAPYHNMDRVQQMSSKRMDPKGLERLEELKKEGFDTNYPERYCKEHQRVYLVRQMGNPTALSNMKSNPCAYQNEWPRNLIAFIQKQPPPGMNDWRVIAGTIQAPTLVLHGAEDLIPLESSAEWASTIPNAKLEIIEGSGHYPQLEAHDIFFALVNEFLDS